MSFEEAVRASPAPVNDNYRGGIQALASADRSRVRCANPRRLTGSIALDEVLSREAKHANAPRWDYGIGYRPAGAAERVIWVEVHPAETSKVGEVVNKLNWLRTWLRDEASQLESMTVGGGRIRPYVWIATAGVRIPRNSPQARQLSTAGLEMPRRVLQLP